MAKSSKSQTRRKGTPPKKVAAKKVAPKKPAASKASSRARKEKVEAILPFGRMNYILLLIGIGIIGLGFLLMSMDDFVDATEFSVSLYIAPFVVVGGFVEIIYAIMYRAPQQDEPAISSDTQ
ncbi:MAG: DUF3098 domain-containing protein [Bacteroidota bacterium]